MSHWYVYVIQIKNEKLKEAGNNFFIFLFPQLLYPHHLFFYHRNLLII